MHRDSSAIGLQGGGQHLVSVCRSALLRLLLVVLLAGGPPFSQATTPKFEPARLRDGAFSLLDQIQFPKVQEDAGQDIRVVLACTASATRKGKLSAQFCLATDLPERPYRLNALRAVKRSKVTPGRVDGKAKNVVVKFTVIFERKAGKESVYLIPNQMHNAKQFGSNYLAPQLIRSHTPDYPNTCRGMKLILRIFVGADGVPSNPEFHRGDPDAKQCIEPAMARVPQLRFIPGMVNGKATAMHHLYLMGWR